MTVDLPPADPPPVVVETGAPACAAVIWLHGLGADGHDFAGVVPMLGLPRRWGLRFVFPHAPYRSVTLNQGHVMRAWYDILGLDLGAPEDREGLAQARALLHRWLDQERRRGLPARALVVAGFSQGAAVALHGGLSYPEPLGGIIALSGYLPLAAEWEPPASPAARETPVFMAHGRQDPVVPYPLAEASRERLRPWLPRLAFHAYDMGHSVSDEELGDIGAWLRRVLEGPCGPAG